MIGKTYFHSLNEACHCTDSSDKGYIIGGAAVVARELSKNQFFHKFIIYKLLKLLLIEGKNRPIGYFDHFTLENSLEIFSYK